MLKRSKLFATVALPVLSVSLAFEPALADSLRKPFEVAQEESIQAPDGEQVPEELLRKRRKHGDAEQQQQEAQPEQQAQPEEQQQEQPRRKKRDAEQQQEAQPEQQAQPEEQPQEKPRRKQRDAEQQQEAQPEQQAQPEEQPQEKPRRKKREAEQQQEAQPEQQAQPEEQQQEKPRRKQRDAEQQQEAQPEQQAQPEEQPQEKPRRKKQDAEQQQQEQKPAEEPAATQEEPTQAKPADKSDADKATEERRKRAREERRKREQQQEQSGQTEEQQKPADEARPADNQDDATKAAEERKRAREERRKQQESEQPATEEQAQPGTDGELRPSIDENNAGNGENAEGRKPRDRRQPPPEVKDTRTEAEKQEIAKDPSKTDETVVLPTDNGAAVLDSDKDADNRGGNQARERRREQRERARNDDRNIEVPKSDAEAQADRRDRRPSREELGEAINERGRRIDRAPEFGLPDLIDALTGNNRERPRVEERGNRTVIDYDGEIYVRGDDRPRLRRDAQDTYYEELPRGRTREVIERRGGVRIVTIYNRYGDIVQRSRIDADGREYLMIYAPEADEGPRPPMVDVGDDLPPMRLQVPVRDYIIDTSSDPDRNYYDFLAEPPVERVERTYTIDEVRNSARIRDKVRRIDLDTITFATGSSEVPMSQAKTLRKVADAMLEVIDKDPGETFLIEGHTDAVGSDESNLVLSDERAESVASLLSEVYDIPPENLVTQGYGERYLKIRTSGPEQENRRVTIRRVTPLVRPVAQK